MKRPVFLLCALAVWCGPGSSGLAQAPPADTGAALPAQAASPDDTQGAGIIKGLPAWLRLGVEFRGRVELNVDPDQDFDDRFYLNRLRLSATVEPARWVRFHFEGQDARAFSLKAGSGFEGQRNTFDVRQGYFELGHAEQGLQVRIGRQDLSVGDERLVGADNYWDAVGQAFDAMRVSFAGARFRVEAFTGFRVEPARRRPDPFDTGSRISGISARFETGAGEDVLEPYLLWKRGGDTLDLVQRPGHRDVATPGLRAQGDLPRSLDYNVEMALQRGHVAGDRISAWAGHWELGWMPLGKDLGPRLGLEYNFASGDADPDDGRHRAFDDLYPAGFNKYGITDPFAWRNISYPAVSVDVPLTRRWTFYGGWRSYWLATTQDGLYPGGDEYLVRNPGATSSHIGSQVFFSAGYERSERWRVHAGYGHLLSGVYLQQSGYSSALRTAYLMTSFAF
jgi:hypothetical protein